MDKKPLIGIVTCILLITNVSVVLGHSNEKGSTFDDADGNLPRMYPNLAPNPSFEEGDTMPTGWIYSGDTSGIFHWDSTFAHSGEKSVGVLNLTNYQQDLFWITTDFIPVDPQKNSYIFSTWYKFIESPVDNQVAISWVQEYDVNYNLVGWGGPSFGFSSEWESQSWGPNLQNNVKYVKLQVGQHIWSQNEPNPLVEVRFDDIFFGACNIAPNTPTIMGETQGKVRTLYEYNITTNDSDQDLVQYVIDWDDNTTQTTDFYESGETIMISHIWGIERIYNVKVKAIDENEKESDWATLDITMPYTYQFPLHQLWMKILERFPNAFPILQYLLGFN
jgi:hypothetical protein